MERLHKRRPSVELVNANQQLDRERAKVAALKQLLAEHGIEFADILQKLNEEQKHEDATFDALSPRTKSAVELLRSPSDALNDGFDEVMRNVKILMKDASSVTVQFKDLSVFANVRPLSDEVPTLWTGVRDIVTGPCRRAVPKERKDILRGITGELKPGTMTLLLGPPGCGKTVFMKAISGRLHNSLQVEGEITYNGDSAGSDAFRLPKIVFYVDEDDEHAPTLTVKETLEFAWQNATGGTHAYGTGMSPEEAVLLDEKKTKVNFILRLFGLKSAMNTVVGNELLRGISGGERRRLTSAEMCVTVADVGMMDAISTGLDSASTFDIINTLRLAAKELNRTVLISLLQPPPEVFDLFDDVMVMAEGRLLYHGPKDNVLSHFKALGYDCPPYADIADFLQQVSQPEGKQFLRADMVNAPSTAEEFAQAFQDTDMYLATVDRVDATRPGQHQWSEHQRERYATTWFQHLKYCIHRQYLLVSRDKVFLRSRAVQSVVMGLLVGSLYFDLPFDSIQNIFGLLQFAAMFLALGAMPQMMVAFAQRPVLYKHADASLFPSSAFVISQTLVQIPISLLEVLIFGSIVYFMAGLANSAERSFTFVLIIFVFQLAFGQLFRTMASIIPTIQVGQPLSGLIVLLFSLFSGFMMAKDDIPDYWIWAYWINPVQWVLQALAINQFTSDKYMNTMIPVGPGKTEKAGVLFLEEFGYETHTSWIWYSVLVLLAEYVVLTGVASVAYTYIRFAKQYTNQKAEPGPVEGVSVEKAAITAPDETAAVETTNGQQAENAQADATGARQASGSGIDLPFHPATIAFKDLWYTIQTPSGDSVDLLKGVHGYCKPGTLMALMGSSGAGKTTLLDVIAGRKTGGTINGVITVNGMPKNDAHFRRIMGYCEQLDVHSPHTTVAEALMFSAQLRLPASVDDASREAFVQNIMNLLELNEIAEAVVGIRGESGLSFEQRKRLTIGVELVANPAILFLDEPTSGLDARSALIVMQSIKRVAASGRTVICTIHQPNKAIFQMFDSLLLLKRGGEVVYFGPLGENSCELIEYLGERAPDHPFRFPANPATWMLEVIGAGTAAQARKLDFGQAYRASSLFTRNELALEGLAPRREDAIGDDEEDDESADHYTVSRTVQFKACMRRAVWSYWRTPTYNVTRLVMYIIVAVIFGSCFAVDPEANTDTELRSRLAVLYLSMLFMGIISMMTVMPVMAQERAAFYREQASHMYEVGVYSAAYGLVEIPYIIFTSAVWTNVFYWLLGFSAQADKFLFYWVFFGLFVGMMTFMGQFVACVTPNLQTGQLIGSVLNSLFNLFCGFMITPGSIPDYWIFLYWLAPTHYAYEGVVVTQFHGDDSKISTSSGQTVTTEDFVDDFFEGEFQWSHRIYDIIVLIGFMAFFRAATYLSLKFLRYQTR